MNKGIGSDKIVDLTPLLDVVLILLFALLLNMSVEQERVQAEADELMEEIDRQGSELEDFLEKVKEKDLKISELEGNVHVLNEQNQEMSQAVTTWFASQEVRASETLTNDQVIKILDAEEINQSLYQMDFIANQFFFIEIDFDERLYQEVRINGQSTGVQLNFDIRHDQTKLDKAYSDIFDELEKVMSQKDSGYRFVLFTLTDNGHVYSFAYDLVWSVIKEIETKYTEDTIYKLQYLNYE